MPAYSEKSRRILALEFPQLAVDRIRRSRKRRGETPADYPLVVVAKIENVLQLTAIDDNAAREGLHTGLPLADARARLPTLDVVEANEAADSALLEAIADWCGRFTPLVAINKPYGLLLDISGCAHLFGGESALLRAICNFIFREEIVVQAAIAGTTVAAYALAKGASGSIIENGKEKEAVSTLPLAALKIDNKVVYALKRAGLKSIGEAAARSSSELAARFGAAFTFLLEQAQGYSAQPIIPRRALPDYAAERRFAEPVATVEVIGRTIFSLASTIQTLLEERGQGARRFEASFFRTDGAVRHIVLDTGQPLRDAVAIGAYYSERLEVLADPLDPGFGFDLIRLSALATEKLVYSATEFQSSQDEHEIAGLIDRLSARFGASRVTRFFPVDTHIPEYAAAFCPAQRGKNPSPWQQTRLENETPRRPLHMVTPPEQVENALADVPDGPPRRFTWRRATHRIVKSDGPERIAMEWWRDANAKTRDYFQVEDEDGRRFWLYRDGIYNRGEKDVRWFIHGLFA
jgi:protein ImuB